MTETNVAVVTRLIESRFSDQGLQIAAVKAEGRAGHQEIREDLAHIRQRLDALEDAETAEAARKSLLDGLLSRGAVCASIFAAVASLTWAILQSLCR